MKPQLNKKYLAQLPAAIKRPSENPVKTPAILHFGVGGFHRSHQAFYFQELINRNPGKYGSWSIVGACILPQDKVFVENMKQQDFLYTLKSSSSEGKEELQVVSSISNVLYGPTESLQIIGKIASHETRFISFTITEGGYMLDEATGDFQITHPDIEFDMMGEGVPKTVFGYLARGLAQRRQNLAPNITFLSCDNVQENGQVLKKALLAFLEEYDVDLKRYVLGHVSFPNSMVDRITPVTTATDKDRFEEEFNYRDECLVLSEDFCQWIIEGSEVSDFPPLQEVGATMVKDVRPYEKMKLRLLNGGHSLVGLLGKTLGYEYIHNAVKDEQISQLFDQYIEQEAIPSLDTIEGLSFFDYMHKVKSRFGNELIHDSTDRIISFSSAKIPKFILPVMDHSLRTNSPIWISSLILVAWWHYLKKRAGMENSSEIVDGLKDHWEELFKTSGDSSVGEFLGTREVFGNLGMKQEVQEEIKKLASIIESQGMLQAMKVVLDSGQK